MQRVAVVGAGIMGLSTAMQLKQALPRARVTIMADQFLKATTSDGAAGIFRPNPTGLGSDLDTDVIMQWSRDSWTHFSSIARSRESKAAGVSFVNGYHVFSNPPPKDYTTLSKFLPNFHVLSEEELKMFPTHFPYGYGFTTVIAEPRFYMPFLMERFKELGGNFETRKINSLDDLVGECDLVVNCAGLRSRELVGDTKIYPVKGQMLRMHTPWLKYFVYINQDTWIVPGRESTTVGGTRERGKSDTDLFQADIDAILDRASRVVPSIKDADVLWKWAGLRPARDPPRVELETRTVGGKPLKVVHNYGHGGHGIGLSWGSSKHAARLAVDALTSSHQSKL